MSEPWKPPLRHGLTLLLATLALTAACGPRRLAVVGPAGDAPALARELLRSSELEQPMRIDFRWQLNEAGSRVRGVGVARVEPPYRARLDLFLDNGETVVAAAVVEDELRLPPGAPTDLLPPVDLMWATLGVFRPVGGASLEGGDRLEDGSDRLRYRIEDGRALHYEVDAAGLRAVELLRGESVVEWVRVERRAGETFPDAATYRNLVVFRELTIVREGTRASDPFDPAIWDPR